jgi:hypothetical protein
MQVNRNIFFRQKNIQRYVSLCKPLNQGIIWVAKTICIKNLCLFTDDVYGAGHDGQGEEGRVAPDAGGVHRLCLCSALLHAL